MIIKPINTQQVIATARSWLGTPFKLQGRLKGKGCDCLGLIIGVCHELQLKTKDGLLISSLDQTNYHISLDGYKLEEALDQHLNITENLEFGCLALIEYDANPQHLAIIASHPLAKFSMIHADIKANAVVEHLLIPEQINQIKRSYIFTH